MARPRVLITGASGLIGTILRTALSDRYELTAIDARRGPDGVRAADMRNLGRVRRAFEGQEVVVDLAARASATGTWEDAYDNNIPSTFNALEASRLAGVRRVVYASSNHVTGLYERDDPYAAIVRGAYGGLAPDAVPKITTEWPIRPDGPYAIGKAFGEAAARYYADEFALSIVCLRIGTVNRANRPGAPRHFATLLTHEDLVRLVDSCIAAPAEVGFGIFYGVSNNRWRFWDTSNAERDLGYAPADDAERWRAPDPRR